MIIANIAGGVGNQMFQYAAGKALAEFYKVPLKLDISYFALKNYRSYELDKLCINAEMATKDEIKFFKQHGLVDRIIQRLMPLHKKRLVMEPHYHYYSNFFKISPKVYLTGRWQSERYFNSIEPVIRREFTVKPHLVEHLRDKAEEMKASTSVAIHIRRGDYMQKNVFDYFGILPKTYYENALNLLTSQNGTSKIYFFSDDIDWIRQNITIEQQHEFITGEVTTSAIEDLYPMQQCKNIIIANSTFSWWAAWLNNNPHKTVITPGNWFNKAGNNTKDLFPKGWLVV